MWAIAESMSKIWAEHRTGSVHLFLTIVSSESAVPSEVKEPPTFATHCALSVIGNFMLGVVAPCGLHDALISKLAAVKPEVAAANFKLVNSHCFAPLVPPHAVMLLTMKLAIRRTFSITEKMSELHWRPFPAVEQRSVALHKKMPASTSSSMPFVTASMQPNLFGFGHNPWAMQVPLCQIGVLAGHAQPLTHCSVQIGLGLL